MGRNNYPWYFVSGTAAIANITPSALLMAGGGQVTLIPTGNWTTTTAGNIANVINAVANVPIIAAYEVNTAKWYLK